MKTATKKDAALEYAGRGWHVFPLHNIEGGRCSCGSDDCTSPAKHPRTVDGLSSGTTERALIDSWWTVWPKANIGVRTGPESGIVVIDLDDVEQMAELTARGLPDTVNQTTGSGGRHYLFRHPGSKVKSVTKVLPGIDSRGDGGYIVVPPSNHMSGGYYEWNDGPEDIELAECPQWWIEAVEDHRKNRDKPQAHDGQVVGQGARNQTLFDWGCNAWKRMPMSPQVLGALLEAQNATMCVPPLESHEVGRIADSIVKYDGKSREDYEAELHGRSVWESIKKSKQEEIARMLASKATKLAGPMPEFMPKTGLIREVAEYILSQSERPQPVLAVCAATALVGALAGRKYESPSQLGPNLLLVGLAESGSGKERARKLVGKIASEVGAESVIGADDIASAPGLIAELNENPVKLFMLDEFGLFLSSVTDKNSSSTKREIMSVIMRMYSSYGGTYYGTAYADQSKRKKVVINNPCMVLYATSVHQNFYESLSLEHGSDGFISRLLVVPAGEKRPELCRPKYAKIPGYLKAKLVELAGLVNPEIVTVPMTDEVDQAFFDLDESMTALMTTPQTRSVYARVKENAIKLALVHSISMDVADPLIGPESFAWGRDIALWCANHITEKLETAVGNGEDEKRYNRAVDILLSSGPGGITKRELMRRYKGMKTYDRDDLLRSLYDLGDAFEHDGHVVSAKYWKVVKGEE
jgi:hypothetical protein